MHPPLPHTAHIARCHPAFLTVLYFAWPDLACLGFSFKKGTMKTRSRVAQVSLKPKDDLELLILLLLPPGLVYTLPGQVSALLGMDLRVFPQIKQAFHQLATSLAHLRDEI